MLSQYGFEVQLASTDNEFMTLAQAADTWIIDVRLPTGAYEGILAVAELANKGILPKNPIIFISVDPSSFAVDMLGALSRYGITYRWLEKPFEIELLLETINDERSNP